MAMTAMAFDIDGKSLRQALSEAGEKLNGDPEAILDFSSVRRMDSSALCAMEELAHIADAKGTRIVLRDVNVEVYKVLKLVKLTQRFSFEN